MVAPKEKSCKTCKHLDVPLSNGAKPRRLIYPNSGYACLAPAPPLPHLPDSITTAAFFRWPPNRRYMLPHDGKSCPTHEPL